MNLQNSTAIIAAAAAGIGNASAEFATDLAFGIDGGLRT
jgi:hypothetical protein